MMNFSVKFTIISVILYCNLFIVPVSINGSIFFSNELDICDKK